MRIFDDHFWWEFVMTIFVTWHLIHWSHCRQLRTTVLTITLWPLNKEWWGQHSQFLRCFNKWYGFYQNDDWCSFQFIWRQIGQRNSFDVAITFSSYDHAPLSYDSGGSFCFSESLRTAGSLGWEWHSGEFQRVFCSCSSSQILFHSTGNATHDHPPMSLLAHISHLFHL